MKKGKTSQLKLFSDAKCYYGTVDAKNLKTIYIVLQSWVEPIKEFENWDRATGIMERNIKHILLEVVDPLIFEKHNIVDLDLRSSGIQKGKRSFMNLEITLYLKNHMDFKSPILRDRIKNIISSVYTDCLKGVNYFKVHKSKSSKEVV
jgi:hypothetical protein